MRITSKGQVTIPQAVREQTGLMPNTEVDFVVEEGAVRLVPVTSARRASRGARAVRLLRDQGQHVTMTTEQIMALTRHD